jgi:alkyldihydroxyacetonephosphate synthase
MRRWNGWGDERTDYPFPETAARYLAMLVGDGKPAPDAGLEAVLAAVPPPTMPENPLVWTGPLDRLRHARGQSLPDWVALRSGRIGAFPDGVAHPDSEEQVRQLLAYARQTGTRLIPYGGGTSVVGHINPISGTGPVISIDLSLLDRLIELDETSRLASFQTGVSGPQLESQLNARGYTLGHFPQSFELSTLGGWVATRSSGQQSCHYGRIEDLFAGGHVETPAGPLDLPCFPASAAGPDLRQVFLGSEGRMGILTRASVRVRPLPETERFYGVFFHDWESGVDAVRAIAQSEAPVSMLRLSDAQETETTLALSGKEDLAVLARRGLGWLGYGPERCLLIYGLTGSRESTSACRRQVGSLLRVHAGLQAGPLIGRMWQKSRFRTPYLRNTLWERGYALDTLETALPWSSVISAAQAIKTALQQGLCGAGADGDAARALVFAHLSHVYVDGASIYVTYLFHRSQDPDETLHRWQRLKHAASQAVLASGGTISHQHGVGTDHASYLPAEKGRPGMALLEAMCRTLDPDGLLNPGKLLT